MPDTWLIIRTPGGVHCWPLADTADQEPEILAARAAVQFPADDAWPDAQIWDLQVAIGRPHPRLLAGATVHEPGELSKSGTDEYAARLAEARQAARLAEARARWDELPADVQAELLATLEPLGPSKTPTR